LSEDHDDHAAVLTELQSTFVELYDVGESPPVGPFLCGASDVEAAGADPARGEVLLVHEQGDDVSVGLYVAPGATRRLSGAANPHAPERFEAWCLAAEGVSHFVYLLFRAQSGVSVSQLELELQAEVDKYAAALLAEGSRSESLLAGNGVGLFVARSRAIRRGLYRDQTLIDAPGTVEHGRYQLAMETAGRYAEHLERRFVTQGDTQGMVAELRRFYRSSPQEKLARSR
jgi:hypothetical protein